MGLFSDLFIRIADKMGLKIQYKETPYSEDYKESEKINLTAAISNRLTTLTMLDSDVYIDGESERAEYFRDFLDDFVALQMPVAAEVALGTGDCLLKPYTDGERIGISIIPNDDFRICDSIGKFVKSVIVRADKQTIDNHVYERFEGQRLDETENGPLLSIVQFCFRDGRELGSQSEWPQEWQGIERETYITGCEKLLLGRYRCPTINRKNINSVDGVKITYGLDDVMNKAAEAYERFNDEMRKKETMIFADRTLFTTDEKGNRILPKGKAKLFQAVKARDGGQLIQEFSPDLRADELEKGIDVNFRILELMAGLSSGILTSPTTNFATATELKASLQLTFAFITRFRKALVSGTDDLLDAIDVLLNINGITPVGDWEARYDWSSSYIENLQEQFNRLVVAQGIGAVSAAEVRSWVMDEDIDTAEERVMEIESTAGELLPEPVE